MSIDILTQRNSLFLDGGQSRIWTSASSCFMLRTKEPIMFRSAYNSSYTVTNIFTILWGRGSKQNEQQRVTITENRRKKEHLEPKVEKTLQNRGGKYLSIKYMRLDLLPSFICNANMWVQMLHVIIHSLFTEMSLCVGCSPVRGRCYCKGGLLQWHEDLQHPRSIQRMALLRVFPSWLHRCVSLFKGTLNQ